MISVNLTEHGAPVEQALTLAQGQSLARSKAVSAVPSPYRHGVWLIGPMNQVGAARIGGIEISVKPKVPIAGLLFLVGYASHGVAWLPDTGCLPSPVPTRSRSGCSAACSATSPTSRR